MTRKPKVLICNERFLARFGVDQILVLLAEHLKNIGAEVSFACLRSDRAVLARISSAVDEIVLPEGLDPVAADGFISRRLRERWREDPPDVVITGGWPFFGAAAQGQALGVRSVFIDAGAVPQDGFPEFALPSQLELRRLRQQTLPAIGLILPISDFIRESQTEFDRGSDSGVHTVLLGADHLADRSFDLDGISESERALLLRLEKLAGEGQRLILALGRYESFGYKNSDAAFRVLRSLISEGRAAHLIVLAGKEKVEAPQDLAGAVTFLDTVSDAALQAIMQLCVLGLSLTRWEGFNLPLAEMQWLGKPVLAYNIGAHPEVVAEPWFLSESEPELVAKAAAILDGSAPPQAQGADCFERFRERFRWGDVLDKWSAFTLERTSPPAPAARRLVLMDVGNSARDPANSGVIRVTRRLAAQLVELGQIDLVFVIWDQEAGTYRLLSQAHHAFLSSNAGPVDWLGQAVEALGGGIPIETVLRAADPASATPPVLFLPEVILDGSAAARIGWAKQNGLSSAAIFYDMLPIFEAHLVDSAVSAMFPAYVDALCELDALWAISGFSLSEFNRYNAQRGVSGPRSSEAVWLPGQFSDCARISAAEAESAEIEILCVSTIEPRKNHRVLVEAFQRLVRARPDLSLRLTLVGNSYSGSEDLTKWLQGVVADDEQIVWRGILPDVALADQYRRSAFTVYPSLAEGFGLPILESLWMRTPCLCHNGGVMSELAADGGCITVDMNDASEVAEALEMLATTSVLRAALARQAAGRQIDTWRDYAIALTERLQAV